MAIGEVAVAPSFWRLTSPHSLHLASGQSFLVSWLLEAGRERRGELLAVEQVELGEEPLDGGGLAEADHVVVRPRDLIFSSISNLLGGRSPPVRSISSTTSQSRSL